MKNIILVAVLGAFFAGCSTNLGTYTIASTGIMDMDVDRGEYIEGKSCMWNVFFVPFGTFANRITLATMDALERAQKQGIHAEVLTDVAINVTEWTAILVGQNCIEVRGRPIKNKAKLIKAQK